MLFDELYLERKPTGAELTTAVAAALSVDASQVKVVADAAAPRGGVEVLVELSASKGQFAARCGLYPNRPPAVKSGAAAKVLAKRLGCRVLRSGGVDDPYRALVVDADGKESPVVLDQDALDGRQELLISSAPAADTASAKPSGPEGPVLGAWGSGPERDQSDQARIDHLIAFYLDTSLSHGPGTADQQRAFEDLSQAVIAGQSPQGADSAQVLKEHAERVKKLWPASSRGPGTSLGALLEAAELMARR